MAKDIVASVGKYTNNNGEEKYNNVKVGVILEKNGKEFALIDPTVNIAGVLAKQNMLNHAEGKQIHDSVMCSIFDNSNRQQQPQQNQQQPQQNQRAAPAAPDDFNDDLPF
jgi:single-stranded DNA-binding protein